MRPHYSLVTASATEPLTIEQASEHVRIDSNDDLVYLESLIGVAREYVEAVTGKVSTLATYKLVAPSWHSLINGDDNRLTIPARNIYSIPVYRTPLVSVTSIKYYPPNTESQTTISASDYRVITTTEPGIIQFKESPPSVEDRPDAIEIVFVAGYADSCNTPPGLKHAQKMLVAHWYEQRVPVSTGGSVNEIPFTLKTLIENQKVGGWIA